MRRALWPAATLGAAGLLAVPVLGVLASLAHPRPEIWGHLWRTQLPELIANTLCLVAGVGAGSLALGTTLAWLVVAHEFPGRRTFEWALMLPLAVPAYVIGFAFLGLFDFAGPVQTLVREGLGLRLPDPRGWWGVTLVMTLVFYPYVYLLARTAFREQGAATMETARALGRSRGRAFLEVGLPLARPSLVAGAALAMMEALADFGTVATFGYRTFTEAIYRVWTGMFDRQAATQLASLLLLFALALLLAERALRGRARFTQRQGRSPALPRVRLRGSRAALASGACLLVLGLAFLLPLGQLLAWAASTTRHQGLAPLLPLLGHTLLLASAAAVLTALLGGLLAYARRLHRSLAVRGATQVAAMGYALPGSVIAVGVLVPLAWLDRALLRLAEGTLGVTPGLLLTGTAASLLFAYAARFLAVGFQTLDASLTRIPPSLDEAARSLGARPGATLRRVHLPLMRGGLSTALVLVFVETIKEMPATLLLRPLGLNTLAIAVWERTSESLWGEAAAPALVIVLAGLAPVVLAIRLGSPGEPAAGRLSGGDVRVG